MIAAQSKLGQPEKRGQSIPSLKYTAGWAFCHQVQVLSHFLSLSLSHSISLSFYASISLSLSIYIYIYIYIIYTPLPLSFSLPLLLPRLFTDGAHVCVWWCVCVCVCVRGCVCHEVSRIACPPEHDQRPLLIMRTKFSPPVPSSIIKAFFFLARTLLSPSHLCNRQNAILPYSTQGIL